VRLQYAESLVAEESGLARLSAPEARTRMRWPIHPDSYRREDRFLALILKGAFVFGIVAVEAILIAAFGYLVWTFVT
jgi:hypothetical protein